MSCLEQFHLPRRSSIMLPSTLSCPSININIKLCMLLQRNFSYRRVSVTSELLADGDDKKKSKEPVTEYDKLVQDFYSRLLAQRKTTAAMQEKNRRWSMQKVMKQFPGWNETTIANLHSLFLLFDNRQNGMLSLDDFCAVLESLGDESTMEERKSRYEDTDKDNDGWISYDEFLSVSINNNITKLRLVR
ncbi:unnamed protein product [Timema podura]|uniref:EF-hand domain-containing protein n=1 Tax=Timema podura TaxID=61482 RepID=A0ABN7PAV0_TIMPD|nr:unnamed protein product [Timema podura]